MSSLERRLQVGLAISLVLLAGSFWALGHWALGRLTEEVVLSRLQDDAEAILEALRVRAGQPFKVGRRRLAPVYSQPMSGHYYIVETRDEAPLLSLSLGDRNLEIPELPVGEHRRWRVPGPEGQRLLVWAVGYQKEGAVFTLAVAEDIDPMDTRRAQYERWFAAISAAGLFLVLAVQRAVIHRGFRRLRPLYTDIQRLEQGEAVRLSEDVPSEILPLVRKFNGLLQRLTERIERSRSAVGNLAHALKTPLSLLRQLIEGRELDDRPELRVALADQARRIEGLMQKELKRARLAGTGAPGRRFDLQEELPALIEVVKRIHDEKPVEVECSLATADSQPIDREDMLELLGNLLDNAWKWARGRVRCSVRETVDGIEYCIEDDGPGCSDEQFEQITRRGVRLDENMDGHGLGLAIARDIVKLYGGELLLDRSPELAGFRARAVLRKTG